MKLLQLLQVIWSGYGGFDQVRGRAMAEYRRVCTGHFRSPWLLASILSLCWDGRCGGWRFGVWINRWFILMPRHFLLPLSVYDLVGDFCSLELRHCCSRRAVLQQKSRRAL